MDYKRLIPFLAMPLLLILVEIVALVLSLPVQEAGITAFEDPTSVANIGIFVLILLVFTGFLLLLIRFGLKKIIALVIAVSIFLSFCYIFSAIVNTAIGMTDAAVLLMLALSLGATVLLYKYPEWYVIDTLGVLIAAGVASIFGVSLDIVPVVVLLILLAVYDAISVYKTKHMITLAEGVIDLKTPILFVIPKRRDYSFIREGIGKLEEGGERAAFIMGMGDLIMPSILVVSANVFMKGYRVLGFINLPAIGAIIGSLAGLVVLLYFVNSGRPQAGLPPLNGGTLTGFALGWALSSLL
ncbi:MAG: presenilin family intramembrane aspartyl protease [Methanoregula sp.]|nr:MAG: presenilin family intramembrane aspartyl protease [Methanoregula sp.]